MAVLGMILFWPSAPGSMSGSALTSNEWKNIARTVPAGANRCMVHGPDITAMSLIIELSSVWHAREKELWCNLLNVHTAAGILLSLILRANR